MNVKKPDHVNTGVQIAPESVQKLSEKLSEKLGQKLCQSDKTDCCVTRKVGQLDE